MTYSLEGVADRKEVNPFAFDASASQLGRVELFKRGLFGVLFVMAKDTTLSRSVSLAVAYMVVQQRCRLDTALHQVKTADSWSGLCWGCQ